MPARWKSARRETLILMHAHNQWSRWNDCKIDAAEQLGLLVGKAEYQNCSGDGSYDQEWYVLSAQLKSVGGMPTLENLAHTIFMERNPTDW